MEGMMKSEETRRDTRRKKILLVDDEPLNIKVLSEILRDSYRIMVATRGTEALKCAASSQPPDLVLLDLVMPGMDGLEVCRRLKESENTASIPVIFITGQGKDSDITAAMEAGAVDCMRKPVHPLVLKQRVKLQLEMKKCRSGTAQGLIAAALQQEKEENQALRTALRAAEQELEASRQYRHMFLAEMHHEIKTHLTTIVGMAGLARKQELSPVLEDYISTIQQATDTLVALINDIVDLSLIEEGELEAGNNKFSPGDLVNMVADSCSEVALKKNVELVIDSDPQLPSLLYGADARLRQMLTHLLHFNIKWLGSREILLETGGRFGESGRFILEFKVSARDAELTRKEASGLFSYIDPMSATHDRRTAGSGLGLPICRRIVEKMSGRISVESGEDSGVEFICSVPVECIDREPRSVPGHYSFRGLKVLLADDSLLAAEVTAAMLSREGCAVDVVDGWEAVLDILTGKGESGDGECRNYDLLVLDWTMPGMDGMEVVERIRSAGCNVPVVVAGMPALLMMSMSHRCSEMHGANGKGTVSFIMKPVKRDALFQKVAELTGRHGGPEQDSPRYCVHEQHLEGMRLLLVEDNAINRQIVRQLLEGRGIKVTGVSSGRGAVEAASRTRFDVILMDIELPDISGIEAAREILSMPQCRNIPVIALTAHSWRTHRKAYDEAGMKSCIEKPIDPDQLYRTLSEVLACQAD